MYLGVLSVFLTLLVLSSQAPIEEFQKCAKKCSEAENFIYEFGKVYNYKFETKTRLSFDKVGEEIKITGLAKIVPHKDCNFELKLEDVQLIGVDNQNEHKTKLEQDVLVFSFDDGLIANVCPVHNEERWSLNIKKAILSGLQVTPKTLGQYNVVDEKDILGDCETTYEKATKGTRDGTKIMKKKNLNNCVSRAHVRSFLIPSNLLNLGPTQKSIDYPTNADYKCIQTLNNEGIIRNVECTEENIVDVQKITKRQYLRETSMKIALISVDSSGLWSKSAFANRKDDSLLFTREIEYDYPLEKIEERLHDLCVSTKQEENSNMVIKSPENFKKLSRSLRGLSYEDVKTILSKVQTNEGIRECRSSKLYGLLESALVVSGGKGAVEYFTNDFEKVRNASPKQWLTVLSLPFLPDPSEETVKAILPFLRSSNSPSLVLFASSLIGNHIKIRTQCPSLSKPVNDAIDVILNKLPEKCSSNNENEIVTYLKALSNIHFVNKAGKEKLISCIENVENSDQVRVAAIEALRQTHSCVHQRTDIINLVNKLFTSNNENDEIEASAYRLLVECGEHGDQEEIVKKAKDILMSSENKRIFNYLLSYLRNYKKSDNPETQKLSRLIDIPTDLRLKDGKYSRNYRYSQYIDKLSAGIDLDVDVVYNKDSKYPKKATFKVNLPTRRNVIELIEFEVRQESDEQHIDAVIDELKKFIQKENYGLVVDYLKNFVKYEDNKIKTNADFYKLKEKLKQLRTSIKEVSWSLSFNGNTLIDVHLDNEQTRGKREPGYLSAAQGRGRPLLYSHPLLTTVYQAFDKDEGFGMMLVDSTIDVPTVSGLPVRFCATATLVSGTKFVDTQLASEQKYRVNVWPNFAFDLTLGLTSSIGCNDRFGFKYTTTGSSNFAFNTEIKSSEDRYEIEVKLPEGDVNVLKLKSALYIVKGKNKEILTPVKSSTDATCYSGKYTGLSICHYNVIEQESAILDNYIDMGIYVKQSKSSVKGWRGVVTYPSVNPKTPFYFLIANLGSSQDDILELKLTNDRSDSQKTRYDFQSKCPKAKIVGTVTTSFTPENFIFEIDYDVNGRKRLISLTNSISPQENGQQDISTKLRIDLPFLRSPIGIDGNVNLLMERNNFMSRGKFFYVNVPKGTQIRMFSFDVTNKADKDDFENVISLQVGNSKFKGFLTFQSTVQKKGPLSIDTSLEYKLPSMVKSEKVNLIGKYFDKSAEQMDKFQLVNELSFTQWPEFNYHFEYNYMHKQNEYFENEFTMKWSGEMNDDKNKVRIFHITKTLEDGINTQVNLYYGPTNFQYNIEENWTWIKNRLSFEIRLSNLVNLNSVRHGKLVIDSSKEGLTSYDLQWKCPRGIKNLLVEVTKEKTEFYLIKAIYKNEPNDAEAFIYEISGKHPNEIYPKVLNLEYDIVDVKNKLNVGKVVFKYDSPESVQLSITFQGDRMFYFDISKRSLMLDVKNYFDLKLTGDLTKEFKLEGHCKLHNIHHLTEMKYDSSLNRNVWTSSCMMDGENIWMLNSYYEYGTSRYYLIFKSFDAELTIDKKSEQSDLLIDLKKGIYLTHVTYKAMQRNKISISAHIEKNSVLLASANLGFTPSSVELININIPSELDLVYEMKAGSDHYLRFNHISRGYLHETSAVQKEKPFSYEINSKSIKNGKEVYSMKSNINVLSSKYEYNVESSLNLPKLLKFFIEFGSNEINGNRFGIKYEKNDQNKRPNSIAFRALRTKRSAAVESEVVSENELQWKADASYDKEKGVKAHLESPVVKFNLRADKDMTLESSLTSKVVPIEYHTSMKYHENEKVYHHDMKYKGKTVMRVNYTRTADKIVGDFETYKRSGDFIIEKPVDYKGSLKVNYVKKVSGVKRSLTITSEKVGDNVEIKCNMILDSENPTDVYNAKLTVPAEPKEKLWMKFESKWPNECTTKLDAEAAKDYQSSKMNLERKCPTYTASIDYERKTVDNKHVIKLNMKKNGELVAEIDLEAERVPAKTLKINLKVKSMSPLFDGTSIVINRAKDEKSYKLDMETKLPFIARVYKLNFDCNYELGRQLDVSGKLRVERKGPQEQVRLVSMNMKMTKDKIEAKSSYDAEEGTTIIPIYSDYLYYDGIALVSKTELVPAKSVFELSINENNQIGNVSMQLKLFDVTHIKLSHQIIGTFDSPVRKHEAALKLFGVPMTWKVDVDEKECRSKIVVMPIDKTYPWVRPDEYRFINCYEGDEQPCFDLETVANHKLKGLSYASLTTKVNRKGKFGNKHDVTLKYTNDREDLEDKSYKHTLLITIDKDQIGFNGEHEPMDRTHELSINDRVFRTERHDKKLDDGEEFTINVWSDYKGKPDQKLTVHRVKRKTADGESRKSTITHPVLKKPIEITLDTKVVGTENEGKMYINFSDNDDENIHLDFKYSTEKAVGLMKKIRHGHIYRNDKKVDFVMDDNVSLEKLANGTVIYDLLKKRTWKSEDGMEKMAMNLFNYRLEKGKSVTFSMLFKRLSEYFSLTGNIEIGNNWIRSYDFSFDENGPKQRLESNVTTEANKNCYYLTSFEVPAKPNNKKHLQVCMDKDAKDTRPFGTLLFTEDGDTKPIADFSIKRKEGVEKTYIVTLRWGVEAVGDMAIDMIQKIDKMQTLIDETNKKMKQEMLNLRKSLMTPMREKVIMPFMEHSKKEWDAFIKANPKLFKSASHLETNEVRSISKRSLKSKPSNNDLMEILKRVFNFKLITYNPDEGEITFEFGFKRV